MKIVLGVLMLILGLSGMGIYAYGYYLVAFGIMFITLGVRNVPRTRI